MTKHVKPGLKVEHDAWNVVGRVAGSAQRASRRLGLAQTLSLSLSAST